MALTTAQMKTLAERLEDQCGYDRVSVRPDYSGRGMYGQEVPALTFDASPGSFLTSLGYVAREIMEEALAMSGNGVNLEGTEYEGWTEIDWEDLPSRTDSMGLGTVLY